MLITERLNMKQFIKTFCVAAVAMGLCSVELKAQENGIENADYWLPRKEIGVRYSFSNDRNGHEITLGYRIDDNWTAGISISDPKYRIGAGTESTEQRFDRTGFGASLYGRRYFHLGTKDKWAIYIDGYIGADFLKDNSGNPSSLFTAKLEPGIRYRFFNNHQIFFGPSIGTHCLGFHLGFAI